DRYKDLLRACPHHGFTELHQLDTFYNALNSADQDSLNSAVGGNLLERRTQDVLTINKNKSKVCNSRNKSIVSQVKSSDATSSSSSEIAKLTHAVNQQTSAMTTTTTAILKQFQATPPLASVKAVEEICFTCGGSHLYYQCLAADGNTLLEFRDNIQGYVSVAAVNYNQGNSGYRLPGSGPLLRNTIANPKGELKAITTRSGIFLDGPSIPIPPLFINLKEDERVEETLTDPKLSEFTIKVPPPLVKKSKPSSQETMWCIKGILFTSEKLLELANKPLNENCSAVILKKLTEKLGDPGKFLTSCSFSELKCKALADLGASINLMPVSVWKKLGLPELISTCMTFELANRAICTPAGIARDVFVSVSNFTFLANFVIVDYESDPRVPLILGTPFLRTARALIDVHREEMILRDGDERLTLNMRHDISSYLNQPQKESINMINIYNDSCEDFLEDLFATNHLSGNPTFSSHTDLTSSEVKDDFFDPEGDIVLIEKLIHLDSTKDLHPPHNINPLKIENLLNHDPTKEIDSILEDSIDKDNLADPNVNLVDTIPEMFTNKHALDYSSPLLYDDYNDDLDEFESSDFLPSPKYDSFLFEDFSEVDALPSTNNEDKVFNPGILIHENLFEVNTRVAPYRNIKKISISHASLILEDFDPPLYELPFHKEVPLSETLLSFSSKNEEKFSNLGFSLLKGGNVLPEKLLDLDSTKDLYRPLHVNPLSGSTAYSSSPLLEELIDELALITFPPKYNDDLQFDVESDLKEIGFLLHQDIDSSLKDSIDQIESDTENVYDDPFDSKGEKIKESKLLINKLDLPCDFLLPSEYDSFTSEDFSKVDAKPLTNNEDKVFNPGILIQENPFKIITRVVQDKKLAISNASLVLEDFDPSLHEPLFFIEVL
nr:reverse transcriptase domain-containing protein [Tanacetum cinerariifolium]